MRPNLEETHDTSIYDEALISEEKEIAERLYEWLQRVINHMKYVRYASYVRDNILSLEDIEELGYIGFLSGLKALTKIKATDAEYFSTLDDYAIKCYEKWYLRRRIFLAVRGEIRKQLAPKRQAYTYAIRLEGGLSGGVNPDDASDLYEIIPDRSLSVEKRVESFWTLSMLYKHLNDRQIAICDLLISGYSKDYLICKKAATSVDIGIITFYLQQIIRFGTVRWEKHEYISDSANVRYDFRSNRWVVRMAYGGKLYSLSSYEDLNIALDVRVAANALRASGEFVPWYERHMIYNPLSGTNTFTYPLPGDEKEYSELCNREVRRIFKKNSSEGAPYGVRFDKKANRYVVSYGNNTLGRTKTLEEGLALRKTAEEKDKEGVYAEWLAEYRLKKHDPNRTKICVNYDKSHNGYTIYRYFRGNRSYVARFKSREEAEHVGEELRKFLEKGSFEEWLANFRAERSKKSSNVNQRNVIWSYALVDFSASEKDCYSVICYGEGDTTCKILSTQNVDNAYDVMNLANEHIEKGDFDVWFDEYKLRKDDVYGRYHNY